MYLIRIEEKFGVLPVHEIFGGILVLSFMILLSGIKIVREHDRLVIFRFGKIIGHRGPGMQMVVPLIDRSLSVDTRILALSTPTVEATSLDKVPVSLSAMCRFHIKDPVRAVAKVDDPVKHTMETMHTLLRSIINERDSKDICTRETELNSMLQRALSSQTKSWCVRVKSVEIKELTLHSNSPSHSKSV